MHARFVLFFSGLLPATAALAVMASVPDTHAASRPRAGNPSQPGGLAVATAQIPYQSGGRSSRVDVYYPTTGPAGPAVMILPSGLTGEPEHHAGHGRHLASHGYVAGVVHDMEIGGQEDVLPNAWRTRDALDALQAAPALAGRLTQQAAVVGTHFNGLSALRAAADDARFDAVVGLHTTTFTVGGGGAGRVTVPYLDLGGNVENGLLCPYNTTWTETYDAAGSIHRTLALLADAHPVDFLDPPSSDPFDLCGAPRAQPFVWIIGLTTAWLDYYVRGDMAAYSWLYDEDAGPLEPTDVTSAEAANAPRNLLAFTSGDDGLTAHVGWRLLVPDSAALAQVAVFRAEGDGPFERIAALPLATAGYDDPGRAPGVTYRYSAAYLDRAGRQFQTAQPRSLVAGAPTPTASLTPSPTHTVGPTSTRGPTTIPSATHTRSPTNTRTATLTRTATITRTPTLTRTPTVTRTPTITRTPSVSATPGDSPTPGASATSTVPVTAAPTTATPAEPQWWVYLPVSYPGRE